LRPLSRYSTLARSLFVCIAAVHCLCCDFLSIFAGTFMRYVPGLVSISILIGPFGFSIAPVIGCLIAITFIVFGFFVVQMYLFMPETCSIHLFLITFAL